MIRHEKANPSRGGGAKPRASLTSGGGRAAEGDQALAYPARWTGSLVRYLISSLVVAAILLATLLTGTTAAAQPAPGSVDRPEGDLVGGRPAGSQTAGEAPSDQIIVKFAPSVGREVRDDIRRAEKLEKVHDLDLIRAEAATVNGRSVEEAVRSLERRPGVEYAEPDHVLYPAGYSKEPRFPEQWGLDNTGQTIRGSAGTPDVDINAKEASAVTAGDPGIVVAIIDTGINPSHPDLKDRVWKNPGEAGEGKENNGVDDDGNGYVDDVNGWDFYNGDGTLHDSSYDRHGTHVAGIIAASTNGEGVAGVAPNIKIMPLKIMEGTTTVSKAILAIEYAKAKGARISNNSWGGLSYSQALKDAIETSGQLYIAGAGNAGYNTDSTPYYPASYDSPNILSVAAVDKKGSLASFSNYGATSVDLSAPGVDILSTMPGYPEKPAVTLSSVGSAGGKALAVGFGAEGIEGAPGQASFMAGAFETIARGSQPVVLVDDDRSHVGYQDVSPTLSAAIGSATGSVPEVIAVSDGDGPSLSRLKDKTVVWATGQANSSGSNASGSMAALTSTDQQTLADFLNGGGRLIVTGMDALHRIENSAFVKDTLGLKVVSDVGRLSGLSDYARSFEGSANTVFAGRSYALSSPLANPTYHDSLAPAGAAVATVQGLYPGIAPTWGYMNGTSMAAPHATGAAALSASGDPGLLADPVALRKHLMARGKRAPATEGKTLTGKMVDAWAASDTVAPTVDTVTPGDLSRDVAPDANVEATFSEAIDPSTLGASTFALVREGLDGSTTPVAATTSYDPATRKATLNPNESLQMGATYTATVGAGSGGVRDAVGNPLAAGRTWSFTTLPDTAPPTLQSPKEHLLANSSLGATNVPVELGWSAEDNGGAVAEYELQQSSNGGTTFSAAALPSATLTRVTHYLVPGKTYQYRARARDGAGNWSEWAAGPTFTVNAFQETSEEISYNGAWAREESSGAYGGYLKHATSGGDAARITFKGRRVAWVAAKGPDRGQAEVWLDGQKAASLDLYSSTPQPRKAVFTGGWDSPGSHTLEVRTLGTKGSSSGGTRVDVDAFVVLGPDIVAPTVGGVSPSDGATGVAPTGSVEATFSEAMDASTLGASTFTLTREGSATPVAATVGYDPASRKATLDPGASLEAGAAYTASVRGGSGGVKDAAGNPLAADRTWSFTILPDTVPPDAPVVSLAAGSDTGASATDGLTRDDTPTLRGTAEAGSTVSIYDGAALLGKANADATGGYSFVAVLGEGPHQITAEATDAAGNSSPASAALGVQIDTRAPDSEITAGPSGTVAKASASFEFSSEPGTTFECSLDATDYGSCDPPTGYEGLGEGEHAFRVRAIDGAGNVDEEPAEARWTVDTLAPSAPVIVNPSKDVYDNDGAFVVSGTTDPHSIVALFDNGSLLRRVTPNASGDWRAEMTGVAEGDHTLTARAIDAAGNVSGASEARRVVVDLKPPTVTRTSPEPAASSVGLGAVVEATFSEKMDNSSINGSTFKLLKRRSDGTLAPVAATVVYESSNSVATLGPDERLERGVTYLVRVKAGVRDLAANPMGADRGWRFKTVS